MNSPAVKPTQRRMSLAQVSNKPTTKPFRLFLYAVEKFGKSTFASMAPAPVFIAVDDGLAQIRDPNTGLMPSHFPQPESWGDVIECIDELIEQPHQFKTLVLDPLGWLETMVYAEYIRLHPKTEKGEVVHEIDDYGWFKGQRGAVDVWRILLARLERLMAKGMNIILIAHCAVKSFKNPSGPDFDRYVPAMDERGANVLKQWCDAIIFGNYESIAFKGKDDTKAKGLGGSKRSMFTERRDDYDAGNRYGLPREMPFDFGEFYAHVNGSRFDETIESVRKEIRDLVAGTEIEAVVIEAIDKFGNDTLGLRQLLTRTPAKLGESK